MDTMIKTCDKCIYYGKIAMACFCEPNEGMRVFNPTENSCKYFVPINIPTEASKCPMCGNDDIHCKPGLYIDLFTCKKRGYEWR